MSVRLIVANSCQPTGTILATLLRELGVNVVDSGEDAVVSYGVKYTGTKPCLNSLAGGRTKMDEMGILLRAGVKTVPVFKYDETTDALQPLMQYAEPFSYPLLGRKETHMHGKDIMPVFQKEELKWRTQAGTAFFTQYIARKTEYRLWVYRRRHIGAYEKVMSYPDKYRFIGCNYRNGFSFKFVPTTEIPENITTMAAKAVDGLSLDFGAVDILMGLNNQPYVLEVNTAPGVAGVTREGIKKLAAKIKKWEQLGYVNRAGVR